MVNKFEKFSVSNYIQPSPSNVHVIGTPSEAEIDKKKRVSGFTSVPVFKAGEWKGQNFSITDLEEIIKNTNALIKSNIHTPPLKLGHNEEQDLLKQDGLPSAGYGMNFYRVGDTIYCDFVDMPQKVEDLVKAKRYSNVSIELYNEFKHPVTGENIGKVVRAIALLGADVPAVKSLGQIYKMFFGDNFSYLTFSEKDLRGNKMNWTKEEVKSRLPCCYDDVVKFMDENKVEEVSSDQLAVILQNKRNFDDKECPETFKWDESSGQCLPTNSGTVSGITEDPKLERKVCPKNHKWDTVTNRCVPIKMEEGKMATETATTPQEQITDDSIDYEAMIQELCEMSGQDMYQSEFSKLDEAKKKKVKEMAEKVKKIIAKHKKAPAPKMSEGNPADKEPTAYSPEDINGFKEKHKKDISTPKGKQKVEAMKETKPPEEWMAKCVNAVGKNADDPAGLCAHIFNLQMTPEAKAKAAAPKPTQMSEKEKELKAKVDKLEKEKYDDSIEAIKKAHRNILLPKFDDYIKVFSEELSKISTVVKFGEKGKEEDKHPKSLFVDFLKALAAEKMVIFSEIAKTSNESERDAEVEPGAEDKEVKKFSDAKPGSDVGNTKLSTLATEISKRDKIPYKAALSKAAKQLKDQGE